MVNFLSFSDEFQKISAQSLHEAKGEVVGRDTGGSTGAGVGAYLGARRGLRHGVGIADKALHALGGGFVGGITGGAIGRHIGGSIGRTTGNIKGDFHRTMKEYTERHGKTKKSEALYKAAEHFLRSGRRPISADRLLEKETEEQVTPSQVFEPAPKEEEKVSMDLGKAKTLATMGSGAALYHVVNKANEDRKLGRAVRLQQG